MTFMTRKPSATRQGNVTVPWISVKSSRAAHDLKWGCGAAFNVSVNASMRPRIHSAPSGLLPPITSKMTI